MIEMLETSRIVQRATNRSLVILDEVGRGTSTKDGMSLALALLEHFHDVLRCRLLFSTHFHQLAPSAKNLKHLRLKHLAVELNRSQQSQRSAPSVAAVHDDLIFTYKILDGVCEQSFGLHVARLAGMPERILERAQAIWRELK
jgi:DNA mismatch repair protein MutS